MRIWSTAGLVLVTGCGGLPDAPTAERDIEWFIDPAPRGLTTSPVLALHVPSKTARELLLYEGELTAYYVGKIRQGSRPDTLEERRVEATTWCDDEECVLRPTAPLAPGSYTLAIGAVGIAGTFTVGAEPLTNFMRRVWPPGSSEISATEAVYCMDASTLTEPFTSDALVLGPTMTRAHLEPAADASGVLDARCARLVVDSAIQGATVVPPPVIGPYVFDPSPVRFGNVAALAALGCEAPESPFGPGCATVLDDRLIVRGPGGAMLWTLRRTDGGPDELHSVAPGRRFLVRGLTPDGDFDLDVTARDESGSVWKTHIQGHAAPARLHVVINEVLANPFGAEPEQEWVELVNDGSSAVDVAYWKLEDSSRATELPAAVLAPGEFALVVSDAYVPDPEVDLVASPATQLLRVTELGKSGFSNSGELVRLRTPDGEVASRFAALGPATEGISEARREPWALDDEPGAIDRHAPPGASPGMTNTIEDSEEGLNFDVYGAVE